MRTGTGRVRWRLKPPPECRVTPQALVDLFCAVWNEPDLHRRSALLEAVWAPGASYTDPEVHADSAEALLVYIARQRARYPAARVVRASAVDLNHGFARYSRRVEQADGTAMPEVLEFAAFTADGTRIARIVGFAGPLPHN